MATAVDPPRCPLLRDERVAGLDDRREPLRLFSALRWPTRRRPADPSRMAWTSGRMSARMRRPQATWRSLPRSLAGASGCPTTITGRSSGWGSAIGSVGGRPPRREPPSSPERSGAAREGLTERGRAAWQPVDGSEPGAPAAGPPLGAGRLVPASRSVRLTTASVRLRGGARRASPRRSYAAAPSVSIFAGSPASSSGSSPSALRGAV